MLVNELKQELKDYNKKDLEKIIIELYKRVPKKIKEEYNIDDYIKNICLNEKVVKKEFPFDQLVKEIEYFIQCVDSDLYVAPNKIISKKERSNWRFKVKRYYKELNKINPETKDGLIATDLLIKLFIRLSYGETTLLFINWNTFRAISVEQSTFYDTIVKRILATGYTKENLNRCIKYLSVDRSSNEYSYCMHSMLISNLKTNPNREMVIELLKQQVEKQKIDLSKEKNFYKEYYLKENINLSICCILELYLNLSEINEGKKYFLENYIEIDEKRKYEILSELLESCN